MKNVTDSFVFYKSYFDGISTLPPQEQLELYQSLFGYLFKEEQPTVSGVAYGMLQLILPTAQAAIERRESAQKAVNTRWQKEKKEEPPRGEDSAKREDSVRREESARREEPARREESAKREEPVTRGEEGGKQGRESVSRGEPARREESARREVPARQATSAKQGESARQGQAPKPKEESLPDKQAPLQPAQRQHHLGKFHNVFLFDSELKKVQDLFGEKATGLIDRFSRFKMERRLTLLYDFPALIHFEKHGDLPDGMFERDVGSYAVTAPIAGTPPPR